MHFKTNTAKSTPNKKKAIANGANSIPSKTSIYSIIKINPFFHYLDINKISFSIFIIKSKPHKNMNITNGPANKIPIKISKYFICKHSFL